MSKILKNQTGSVILISDTGVSVPASPATYTIPAQDYLLWAASSNIITYIGNGNIVVNDGSSDLSISDGTDLIKGLFPNRLGVLAGTDLTQIGHVTDNLKVIDQAAIIAINSLGASFGGSGLGILKPGEAAITTRTEFDLSGATYTVPSGKAFQLKSFAASYDAPSAVYVRLKKQTGGAGAFVTLFRITMLSGGAGDSTTDINLGTGVNIGVAGDVFKVTIEAATAKGSVWAEFAGVEL